MKSEETTKPVGDTGKNKTKYGVNLDSENSAGTSKNKEIEVRFFPSALRLLDNCETRFLWPLTLETGDGKDKERGSEWD